MTGLTLAVSLYGGKPTLPGWTEPSTQPISPVGTENLYSSSQLHLPGISLCRSNFACLLFEAPNSASLGTTVVMFCQKNDPAAALGQRDRMSDREKRFCLELSGSINWKQPSQMSLNPSQTREHNPTKELFLSNPTFCYPTEPWTVIYTRPIKREMTKPRRIRIIM